MCISHIYPYSSYESVPIIVFIGQKMLDINFNVLLMMWAESKFVYFSYTPNNVVFKSHCSSLILP